MAKDDNQELPEGELTEVLWRMLQAFCWAFVVTGGLLSWAAEPLFDRPQMVWAGMVLAAPALAGVIYAQIKIWKARKADKGE